VLIVLTTSVTVRLVVLVVSVMIALWLGLLAVLTSTKESIHLLLRRPMIPATQNRQTSATVTIQPGPGSDAAGSRRPS